MATPSDGYTLRWYPSPQLDTLKVYTLSETPRRVDPSWFSPCVVPICRYTRCGPRLSGPSVLCQRRLRCSHAGHCLLHLSRRVGLRLPSRALHTVTHWNPLHVVPGRSVLPLPSTPVPCASSVPCGQVSPRLSGRCDPCPDCGQGSQLHLGCALLYPQPLPDSLHLLCLPLALPQPHSLLGPP